MFERGECFFWTHPFFVLTVIVGQDSHRHPFCLIDWELVPCLGN